MKKLVDGKLVDLSTAEADLRAQETKDGAAAALSFAKSSMIERIDFKLRELSQRSWMAETKAQIMASTSVVAVRAIFDSIEWEEPGETIVPFVREPIIIPGNYDDGWIKDQVGVLAEIIHQTALVTRTDMELLSTRADDLERRISVLEQEPVEVEDFEVEDRASEIETIQIEVPLQEDKRDLLRTALERAGEADDAEAGSAIEDLPPIEIAEAVEIEAPEIFKIEEIYSPPKVPPPEAKIIERVIERDTSLEDQIRYEVAMRAINGNVASLSLLKEEADKRGVTCRQLADQIVRKRVEREIEVMRAFASKV